MANGVTYHLQETAFFSWFYNQVPSLGINGWYFLERLVHQARGGLPVAKSLE